MNAEKLEKLWLNSLSLSVTEGYSTDPLPWDWHQKAADFIKPGDNVLDLDKVGETTENIPDNSIDVLLSRGDFRNFTQAHRVLKKNGFFLCECTGSDHCRPLAEYLMPNSRPPLPLNLENEQPKMQAAGFRVMFRNQAYPLGRFKNFPSLLGFIAANPVYFPNFSLVSAEKNLLTLEHYLSAQGFIPNREHKFILIGKKK